MNEKALWILLSICLAQHIVSYWMNYWKSLLWEAFSFNGEFYLSTSHCVWKSSIFIQIGDVEDPADCKGAGLVNEEQWYCSSEGGDGKQLEWHLHMQPFTYTHTPVTQTNEVRSLTSYLVTKEAILFVWAGMRISFPLISLKETTSVRFAV